MHAYSKTQEANNGGWRKTAWHLQAVEMHPTLLIHWDYTRDKVTHRYKFLVMTCTCAIL